MRAAQPRYQHPVQGDTPSETPSEQETDMLLLLRVRRGDELALAALYDRWADRVYSVAAYLAADAEEVVERIFFRVWGEADRYSAARGGVGAWIVMMARSEALSHRRKNARRARHDQGRTLHLTQEGAAGVCPLAAAEMSECRERVGHAVGCLPVEQQCVVRLTFFEGLSQTEIAGALGIPLGTVKTRVRLAFAKLRLSLSCLQETA